MDMTQYRGMFLEEAQEHLQKLNEALLDLEGSPENRAILDEIFRSAHTLKGMSATMGFNQVAELTHNMENVLHKLRNGELCSASGIVDLLFKCVDSLDSMINDIAGGGEGDLAVEDLLIELKNLNDPESQAGKPSGSMSPETGLSPGVPAGSAVTGQNIVTSIDFNEYEKNLIKQAIDQGFQCYHIVVSIDPRCVMKSARAFMIFKNMEAIGEIIKSIPPVQDIEEEKFDTGFEIILISIEPQETVRKGLVCITEVMEPDITVISQVFSTGSPAGRAETQVLKSQSLQQDKSLDINDKRDLGATRAIPAKAKASQTVRVDTTKLDNLINLVGELVINKTRIEQIGKVNQLPDLAETLEQMDRITTDLQNVVMKVRMVPIDTVFSRFPRMVRDLAKELGKEIELIIEGKETELDRTVIDEVGDPLVHLLRNAVDHGIEEPDLRAAAQKPEQGRVLLSARHEGNNVVIEVEDDGKGLNPEALKQKAIEKGILDAEGAAELSDAEAVRLVLRPGFSTAEKITDISGRGVGMDVVKNKIEALSGSINIESSSGRGTRFKIQLPLTLAIIQALLVLIEDETYAIPLSFIAETTSVMPEQVNKIQDQEVILLRGGVLPLIRLNEVLQVQPTALPKDEEINIVVVKNGEKRVGLLVDTLIGQQEIVIKPLGKLLGNISVVSGATILGNGQVSLIIDVAGLF
ncbi:chemotaxis protein CheA [Phosphitispora fastidiosa]|uniref:chemotaxis protein CheA n=1 Tax=Phosphitispora fastidiosa TaxID=2837202 RepID=UPI001E5E7F2F|nr:chemotaxis protein CheA [Phosphitispora fastidiosa]MBU7008289.1 two-component system chemotaxis sensor kinase CheA [Phosphitispora fastidiosa]